MSAHDGVDFSSPSSSFSQPQPVTLFPGGCTTSEVPTDQSATSSTGNASGKVKNKRRQPKYRATKRPPSERRFQCDHCESRFFTQKDVKRHLVVHTGVRNFACPFCAQRFGRKDHLVRHTSKSHGKDTRSFKRRNRAQAFAETATASSTATSNTAATEPAESKRSRKSSGRSKRKADETFAAVQSNASTTAASTASVTTTSLSTSYYPHDNGFSSANRVAATSNANYDNSATLMLSSTSTSLTPFPKLTLVDHPSTSTLTASFTHPRNYPSSFNTFEPSSSTFQYSHNGAFNQFSLPESGNQHYSLQMAPNPPFGYEFKPTPGSVNYGTIAQHDNLNFVHASTSAGHSPNVTSTSNHNNVFKAITSTIVDGFDLDYNNSGLLPQCLTVPIGAPPFVDNGHTPRFQAPFN